MGEALAELFRHNLWANLRLLDVCTEIDDAVLDTNVAGTYGTIRATWVHIAAGEESYAGALAGQEPRQGPVSAEFPSFEVLRRRLVASGRQLVRISESFDASDVLHGAWQGQDYAMPAMVLLIQAINHATEHRTHIKTILSQQGIQPPEVDSWTYVSSGQYGEIAA